ncbi:MAG: efflux RND transporter periplasmic adaptor subunit [Phycisphaerae bacterium]
MKKKIAIAVAGLLILGTLGGFLLKGKAPEKEVGTQTATAAVERGDIRQAVASTGRVVSNLDVEIKCKASGQIAKLPFDVSDTVKTGDLLAELDPNDMLRVLRQAGVKVTASQARLDSAKQNLEIAKQNLATSEQRVKAAYESAQARAKDARARSERMKQLLEKKLTSQEEYDTTATSAIEAEVNMRNAAVAIEELKAQEAALEVKRQDVKLAETQVESDKIDQSIAQDRLNDTKVVSPMDGVVSSRPVQIGQIISSGTSTVGGGTTILTISDLSRVFVVASVDESEIGKVKEGQEAVITADAFPGKAFSGKVVQIAVKGVSASNVVTFEVKIEVTGQQKAMLKPEMTANVEIVAAQREGVLTVPVDAVTRKGHKFIAMLAKGEASEERAVELGINDGLKTEVVSGLAEGDTVTFRKSDANSKWSGGGQRVMIGGPGAPGGGRRH